MQQRTYVPTCLPAYLNTYLRATDSIGSFDGCVTWSSCGKPGLKQLFHQIAEITIPLSEQLLLYVKMLLVGNIRCDLRVCWVAAPSLLAWFRNSQARSYWPNWGRRLNCRLTRLNS